MTTEKTVCVYCGSSFGHSDVYVEHANALGELLRQRRWKLVYGGGTTGLMGAIARATMGNDLDGQVLGIIPSALVSKERQGAQEVNDALRVSVDNHRGATPLSEEYGETKVVPDMHTRKRTMADASDAFVAMPGGYGTMEEVMECITWSQLGIHDKPVVLFNVNGFFDPLRAQISRCIAEGFISEQNGRIVRIANTAEEVIDAIDEYAAPEGRFDLNWGDEGEA